MTSRRIVIGALLALVVLGIGAIIFRANIEQRISPVTTKQATPEPASHWLNEQRRAEQKSERQGVEAACAALRAMGKTDKDCPPQ